MVHAVVATMAMGLIAVPRADATTTTLTGTVTDQAGDPVAGATIEVVVPATGSVTASTTSAADGTYSVEGSWTACATGVLQGGVCVVVGAPPMPGPGTCPAGGDVEGEPGNCYRLVAPSPSVLVCEPPYVPVPHASLGEVCQASNPHLGDPGLASTWVCPPVALSFVDWVTDVINGLEVITSCNYLGMSEGGTCPLGSYPFADECRMPVPEVPGPLECPDQDFSLDNGQCVRHAPAGSAIFSVHVTPPTDSDLAPWSVGGIDLATTSLLNVVLTTTPVDDGGSLIGVTGTTGGGSAFADPPTIVGSLAGGSPSCSVTGDGPHVVHVDLPAATALWVDSSLDIAIETSGNGLTQRHLATPLPDVQTSALQLAPGVYDVSVVFHTVFGAVMQTPCSTTIDVV